MNHYKVVYCLLQKIYRPPLKTKELGGNAKAKALGFKAKEKI